MEELLPSEEVLSELMSCNFLLTEQALKLAEVHLNQLSYLCN